MKPFLNGKKILGKVNEAKEKTVLFDDIGVRRLIGMKDVYINMIYSSLFPLMRLKKSLIFGLFWLSNANAEKNVKQEENVKKNEEMQINK